MSDSYTRRRFGALIGASPLALSVLPIISQPASAADDAALETAINAYIYGYPLVTGEITKMATTNTVAVDMKTFQTPLGQLLSCRVGEDVAALTPHRPGRARLRHPVLHA